MRVDFAEASRDVETMTALGNAKFVELDRQAAADNFEFTSSDRTVRLRGGEPTAWDSRARAKAREIDWDTRNQLSTLRGNVSTTYYSQAKTGGATPFGSTDKPVYLTSEGAAFDHKAEIAVYSGNARAWQDDNFLKAATIQIMQREGRLNAEGGVESMLTEVRTARSGQSVPQPVYASAGSMEYDRNARLIVYRTNADIRQGTDRIQGSVARVYLDDKNEIARSEAEGQVVITQPGRRATGTYALYTASSETVVLRGEPARVFDEKNGSSQGSEVTVHLRDNLVVGKGSSAKDPSGRTRSVFKVRND
jgi:lipopolysaccharide export system protein LptA